MPDKTPDWLKNALEGREPPKPPEEIPWWDGRSQLPDPNKIGCWGIIWEFLKLGIAAFIALAISGGKSCELNNPPKPEPVRKLPWER